MTTCVAEPQTKAGLELPLPEEPLRLKFETRAELEAEPGAGGAKIEDATFLARRLWRGWGPELRERGMARRHFFAVAQGYSAEIRLWVVGERTWDHCVSGLAGRAKRRIRE